MFTKDSHPLLGYKMDDNYSCDFTVVPVSGVGYKRGRTQSVQSFVRIKYGSSWPFTVTTTRNWWRPHEKSTVHKLRSVRIYWSYSLTGNRLAWGRQKKTYSIWPYNYFDSLFGREIDSPYIAVDGDLLDRIQQGNTMTDDYGGVVPLSLFLQY